MVTWYYLKKNTVIFSFLTWHNSYLGWEALAHDSMWQIRNVLSRLPRDLLPTNFAEWRLTVTGSHPLSHITIFSHVHVSSRNKSKMLYTLFHKSFGLQTFMYQGLGWGAPAYKIIWSLIIKLRVKWKIQIKIQIFILQHSRTNKLSWGEA